MASKIEDALENAANATSEEEKREILEAALATKADMLTALADRTKVLREEEAEEQLEHAPVMLDPAGHVAKLTKDTFAEFIASSPRNMVEFYAPWCGHCKKFAPEYEKAAKQFKGRAGFAAVDGTEETQLSRIYNIGGYPTLKWFVHGRPLDYEGPRAAEPLSKWVEDHLRPAYQELDSEEDLGSSLEAALASAEGGMKLSLAICAGSGPKVSKAFRAFEVASERFRGKMLFIWSTKATDQGSIALYRGGRDPEPCPGSCETDDEVIAWIDKAIDLAESADFDKDFEQ
jgi:protein disulfide-isomerase-like protein